MTVEVAPTLGWMHECKGTYRWLPLGAACPICYDHRVLPWKEVLATCDSLEEAIQQSIGAASLCWDRPPTGKFDSERAAEISEALLELVRDYVR